MKYTVKDLVKDTKRVMDDTIYVEVTPEFSKVTEERYNLLTDDEKNEFLKIAKNYVKVNSRSSNKNILYTVAFEDSPIARKMFQGFAYKYNPFNNSYIEI